MSGLRYVAAVVVGVLVLAVPAAADARFSRAVSAATTVTTDVLSAPTDLAVTKACPGHSSAINLAWTATADTYATGYTLSIITATSTTTQAISGGTTTSTSVNIGFLSSTTFTLRTNYRSWTSVATAPTPPVQCTLTG